MQRAFGVKALEDELTGAGFQELFHLGWRRLRNRVWRVLAERGACRADSQDRHIYILFFETHLVRPK